MIDETFNLSLCEAKTDIYQGIVECNKRGLVQSAKWLAELNNGLADVKVKSEKLQNLSLKGIAENEYDAYLLAKSYFDVREYDRAAYFLRNSVSPVPKFLYLYSSYMSKEKKRLDNMSDTSIISSNSHVKDFSELLSTLKADHIQKKLDGYCLYLYGVILKKLDLNQMAIQVFSEAVKAEPTMWGSWLELAPLITDKEKLDKLKLPDHWIKPFFIGYTYIELFLNDEGIKVFEELQLSGFNKCIFIPSQLAVAYSNKRDVERSIEIFKQIQIDDPYRLDNLDAYSNLLFVKDMRTEMAHLAHKAVEINKFRPETCCVIGNYYSIRADHHKAVVYFQRALKLNPRYLSAWTLMGHEFMEMKNTNAAIQSYRQAVGRSSYILNSNAKI